jgi:hypothetical protein
MRPHSVCCIIIYSPNSCSPPLGGSVSSPHNGPL